ncbi:hypothetical protein L226DRAFT_607926 [Lentinus tigrinus ALCF2SS1-7]|uniref:uncharacterized protein n=1 Tax=Lentinus tigrinus ALCF2SS1-7 TaxID=1328758 RepID=UPI00116622A8|nr:hypothetical protein L226DRAFT_607926 [Lentinus tigrinus ALCF2SS1-7]
MWPAASRTCPRPVVRWGVEAIEGLQRVLPLLCDAAAQSAKRGIVRRRTEESAQRRDGHTGGGLWRWRGRGLSVVGTHFATPPCVPRLHPTLPRPSSCPARSRPQPGERRSNGFSSASPRRSKGDSRLYTPGREPSSRNMPRNDATHTGLTTFRRRDINSERGECCIARLPTIYRPSVYRTLTATQHASVLLALLLPPLLAVASRPPPCPTMRLFAHETPPPARETLSPVFSYAQPNRRRLVRSIHFLHPRFMSTTGQGQMETTAATNSTLATLPRAAPSPSRIKIQISISMDHIHIHISESQRPSSGSP